MAEPETIRLDVSGPMARVMPNRPEVLIAWRSGHPHDPVNLEHAERFESRRGHHHVGRNDTGQKSREGRLAGELVISGTSVVPRREDQSPDEHLAKDLPRLRRPRLSNPCQSVSRSRRSCRTCAGSSAASFAALAPA